MFKRTALYAALATVVGGMSPIPSVEAAPAPVVKTTQGDFSFVVIPPGIYSGGEAGLRLVHDYGAFQLWRVDAAHRNELLASAPRRTRLQPTDVVFEAGALSANPDTTTGVQIPEGFTLGKGSDHYIQLVQFAGPLIEDWLDEVRATGAQLIEPVSGNGYLIYADHAATLALGRRVESADHFLQARAVEPFYKLSGELAHKALAGFAGDSQLDITVQIVKHGGNAATKSALGAFSQSGISGWSDRQVLESAWMTVNAADIEKIAAMGDVLALEIRHPRRKYDEVQNQIIAGNFNGGQTGPSGPGYFAWLSSLGLSTDPADYPIVDIVDDGIGQNDDRTFHVGGNSGNPTRLVSNGNCTSESQWGTDGHGHINTSIVGSYDDTAVFPWTDNNGYLRAQGVNPFTRLAHTRIFDSVGFDVSNCGGTDAGLIKSSQDRGAAITSNSWGAGVAGNYDDSSQAYDLGTRDGDLGEAGNQPMIHIFAAGNDGSGSSTVGSPGSGKNMITVGASENFRPSDEDGSWTDGCLISAAGANDALDVISFSSRGPAEGGRTKPEVIAPGTHIQGTANTGPGYTGDSVCDQYRPSGQTDIAASSGTSHSTPAVSGVASLIYYWLGSEYGISAPSAAMMKAYMMAHPTYLDGVGANDNLPSNSQGYGMPNMGAMFDATTARDLADQTTTFDNPGETFTWTGSVVDNAKPLRIAIAWSDAFGAISDTTPQVNDLNLEVTVGGNTYLGNRFSGAFSTTGGLADTANNYEAVFLPAGVSGPISITVTAAAISGDGVPNMGDGTDQDFAFVCNNCSATPDFGIDATPTIAEVCKPLDAQWNVDVAALNGYAGNVNLGASGQPVGSAISFSVNPVAAPGTSVLTLGTAAVAAGDYNFSVTGNDGFNSHSDPVSLQLDDAAPAAPTLTIPADGATDVDTQPTFTWSAVAGARQYTLEVDDDPAFGSINYTTTVGTTSHAMPSSLGPNTTYYWRVRADNHCGLGSDSADFSFTTANLVCATFPGAGLPASIGPGSGVVTDSIATVSGLAGATITDVNVLGLRGTHTWDSDLDVDLIAPDNTTVRVFGDICGSNDNFHINLDDSAATAIGAVCPPGDPNGAAIDASPTNPLSTFNAVDPDGDWTLRITDDAAGDGGQFDAWTLEICALVSTSAVFANADTYNATEDTQLNVAAPGVLGNDTGAGITASLTTPPSNGTIVGGVVNADGSFSYMPAADDCGVGADSFTYTATDGVDSSTATVTIDIACTNDAPVADNDAYVTNVNNVLNVAAPGVLDGDTDVDGDTLTATNLVQPTNGNVVLNADGSFSYTPTAAYCNDGSPTDDFTYTANDGTADSAPATVAITVICDELPVANDDSITVLEGGTATVLDGGNTSVKQNDTDNEDTIPGGDVTLVTGPTFASAFTLNTDGTFSYTHDDSENFSDSFTYTVADSNAQPSNVATVTINITPVADSPEISVTPASLSYALDTGTTDSANLSIQNVGASTLDWNFLEQAALSLPLTDFSVDSLANGGAAVVRTAPVSTSLPVVGFRFDGTVAGMTGSSWASDTCMLVEAPDGEFFVVGGLSGSGAGEMANCGSAADWDFQGSGSSANGAYSSEHAAAFGAGVNGTGTWTFTFLNDWNSTGADTMDWSGVTITLLLDSGACEPISSVSWLSAAPLNGSVGAGLTDVVSVDVDATGLVQGTYSATLCVASNDSVGNSLVEVPVQMNVASPVIDLSPASLTFSVTADQTDAQDLTIGNLGDMALNWSIDEAVGIANVIDRAGTARFHAALGSDKLAHASYDSVGQMMARAGKGSLAADLQKADTLVTQNIDSSTLEALNGVSCPTGPNSIFRRYYLNEYPGVGSPVQINSIDIGMEAVPAAQTMTVNVYSIPGTDPVDTVTVANLTLIASTSVAISAADDNSIINVPLMAMLADPSSTDLVVEVTVPNNFFLGGNVAGSTHPAFIMAAACGLATPDTFASVGFPDSNPIINVNAEDVCAAPSDVPWLSVSPASGTSGAMASSTSSVSVDATGLVAGDYSANLCVNSNDMMAPISVVPVNMTVTVNNAPSFTKGADQTVNEDAGAQSVTGWATAISDGDGDTQNLTFNVTGNTNAALFAAGPTIAANGDLSYTPAANANGSADITITLSDDGGTANGGVDTSASQVFTITVNAVNDAPSFTKGADQSVAEDSGAQSVAGWATAISAGPADESGQTLTFNVTNNTNAGLFSAGPSIAANGDLSYTPAAGTSGSADITITLSDNGGTANSGVDTSASQVFTITVTPINHAPSFTKGADQAVDEDAGAQSVTGWATAISDGDGDTQNLTFNVTGNTNAALFAAGPTIAANGDLSYTPAANANGSADITITLSDDGGTANGGVDTSASQVFTITVNAVNDLPVANDDAYGVLEGGTLAGTTVKANDTDVEDGTPGGNVSLVSGPAHASSFTLNPDGTFSYTHDGSETTTDSFTYTVQDAAGADSNEATVTITITPVDDGPAVANDDGATVLQNSSGNVIDVLANDLADPDDGSLAVTAVGAASNGSTSFTAGDVSYTPANGFCGADSFTYEVNGGITATVDVTVTCLAADIFKDGFED